MTVHTKRKRIPRKLRGPVAEVPEHWGNVMLVKVDAVDLSYERRSVQEEKVEALSVSMAEMGLLQPIGVRRIADQYTDAFSLVWGAHRLHAARRLGWEKIPAVLVHGDKVHSELAEIDENLVRASLTALEEARAIARRKELYEALHPETKRGAKGGRKAKLPPLNDSAPRRYIDETEIGTRIYEVLPTLDGRWMAGWKTDSGGSHRLKHKALEPVADKRAMQEALDRVAELKKWKPELDDNLSFNSAPSFATDTAAKTGKTERTIQRAAKLGRQILPEVAEKIRGLPTADNQQELARLARLDPDLQRTVADMLVDGEISTVKEALVEPGSKPIEDTPPPREKVKKPEAGSWLRERVRWVLDQWRAKWGMFATDVLAAAVLEGYAGELRDGKQQ